MVFFFGIFSFLVVINVLLFLVSYNHAPKKNEKSTKSIAKSTPIITPLTMDVSYKKAV